MHRVTIDLLSISPTLGEIIEWTDEIIGLRPDSWHFSYTEACILDFWFEEDISKSMFILRWSEYLI